MVGGLPAVEKQTTREAAKTATTIDTSKIIMTARVRLTFAVFMAVLLTARRGGIVGRHPSGKNLLHVPNLHHPVPGDGGDVLAVRRKEELVNRADVGLELDDLFARC